MLELGVGADLLRGIGWLLWLLIGGALWLALSKPKVGVANCWPWWPF